MWVPQSDTPQQLRVYRALSSPVRVRMLDVLQVEPELDAAGLGDRLDLHINTVRAHLNVLEDAGLVEPVIEERSKPGRPRRLYRAAGERPSATATNDEGYRFLAAVLASYLGASVDDAAGQAEQAGRAWGSFVIDEPAPFSRLTADETLDRLTRMLSELGFDPDISDRDSTSPTLLLRRCPFVDVAREHEDIVCSVHLGLMRGALAELGSSIEVEDLLPWAAPQGCVSHLRATAS